MSVRRVHEYPFILKADEIIVVTAYRTVDLELILVFFDNLHVLCRDHDQVVLA